AGRPVATLARVTLPQLRHPSAQSTQRAGARLAGTARTMLGVWLADQHPVSADRADHLPGLRRGHRRPATNRAPGAAAGLAVLHGNGGGADRDRSGLLPVAE